MSRSHRDNLRRMTHITVGERWRMDPMDLERGGHQGKGKPKQRRSELDDVKYIPRYSKTLRKWHSSHKVTERRIVRYKDKEALQAELLDPLE